jgi:hypothetical protein
MNRCVKKENRINKVWLIEGPFSFKAKEKRDYRKERFYLGLKQRYGSPGIAVERDVLLRKQQESALANIGLSRFRNCTS